MRDEHSLCRGVRSDPRHGIDNHFLFFMRSLPDPQLTLPNRRSERTSKNHHQPISLIVLTLEAPRLVSPTSQSFLSSLAPSQIFSNLSFPLPPFLVLMIPPKAHVTPLPDPNSPQNHHSIPYPYHFTPHPNPATARTASTTSLPVSLSHLPIVLPSPLSPIPQPNRAPYPRKLAKKPPPYPISSPSHLPTFHTPPTLFPRSLALALFLPQGNNRALQSQKTFPFFHLSNSPSVLPSCSIRLFFLFSSILTCLTPFYSRFHPPPSIPLPMHPSPQSPTTLPSSLPRQHPRSCSNDLLSSTAQPAHNRLSSLIH